MSEHERLLESVEPWLLGSLDPEEAESVRLHVQDCPECLETIRRLRPAAQALGLAVPDAAPPAALRDRIIARAKTDVDGTFQSTPPRPRVRVLPRARAAFKWRFPAATVAATLVLALAVGLFAGTQLGRQSAPPPSSQVLHFTLEGHGDMQGSHASVIELTADGVALVTFSGVPQPSAGKVYELWLIKRSGQADPAGVFSPDPDGSKVVVVERSLSGYNVMAVTVEVGPSGVASPTQQPELYGSVA
jgi:anti-sigma-K factor RskA